MQAAPVPEFIDSPPQILFWEADEIAPIFAGIGIGIITGTLTYLLIPMYFFHKYFTYFKDQHMRGYLLHLLYRIGAIPLNPKFPNGAIDFYHV